MSRRSFADGIALETGSTCLGPCGCRSNDDGGCGGGESGGGHLFAIGIDHPHNFVPPSKWSTDKMLPACKFVYELAYNVCDI